ncbi:MAG: DHH family phosphoesterase [Alistipes sp.]|nr:DHH family phosphoesterase [Alistipes sp.]
MIKMEQLLNCIKSEHVYIQTHNFPDPDAIASAYGMKVLLEQYGIDTTICYKGKIDRYSMMHLIEFLDTEVVNMDEIVYMQGNDEIILVDSQKGNANIVDLVGDEIICIDHHPTYEKVEYRFCDIRPDVGACASIVAEYFKETGKEIDAKTATALLYGIKVDTANLSRGVSKLDLDMFYILYWKANHDIINKLGMSEIQFNDLAAYANAIQSIKVFDNISIAHTGENCPEPLIASISDFMLALSEIDCSIVYSNREDGIKLSVRSCDPKIDSGILTNTALKGIGSGGGHQTMAGGFVPYPDDMDNMDLFIHSIEERFMEELARIHSVY